jgi:hypothetical protein
VLARLPAWTVRSGDGRSDHQPAILGALSDLAGTNGEEEMRRLFVAALEQASILFIGALLLLAFVVGYAADGIGLGFLLTVLMFLFGVPFFGLLFTLLEMNESLRAIRAQLEQRL